MKKIFSFSFYAIAMISLVSCGTMRKAEDGFYENHSKTLGIKLTGREDKNLIVAVENWLGTPYKYGGSTKKGIDCSGLICALYKETWGLTLPRNTSDMAKKLSTTAKHDLRCGDVIFFTIKEKKVSHAGMYIADGKFVHASSTQGVRIANLSDAYWQKYYAGAVRHTIDKQPMPSPAVSNNAKQSAQTNKPVQQQKLADDVIIVFDDNF
jgi:hypothetical protein